jgi:hypothetical protein
MAPVAKDRGGSSVTLPRTVLRLLQPAFKALLGISLAVSERALDCGGGVTPAPVSGRNQEQQKPEDGNRAVFGKEEND